MGKGIQLTLGCVPMVGKGVQLTNAGCIPTLQTATSQRSVLLGSGVSPHFQLSMKVVRKIHFRVSSDLVSLSLATSWSAVSSCARWLPRHGFAFHDVPLLNKTEGVFSCSVAFFPLVLLIPACCWAR